MFSSQTDRFFFVFRPWCPLYWPCALKRLSRFQAPKWATNPEKVDFPGLGGRSGLDAPDQSCLHAKCGPSEPCLGSNLSLGPGIWPFWRAVGVISSVGDRFCLLGTQPTKNPFWPELGATGEFLGDFWLTRTTFALRNFLTLTTLGAFTQVF